MKLRVDLLDHLKDEDILEEALAISPRFKPEPVFSRTGVGSLSSASTEQSAQDQARSTDLIQKVMKRAANSGKTSD